MVSGMCDHGQPHLSIHILSEPEPPEVELPDTEFSLPARQVALGVREREAQLNELKHVNIHLQRLVVVFPTALEVADGSGHNACGVPSDVA